MGSHIACNQCQQPTKENFDYSNLTPKHGYSSREIVNTKSLKNPKDNGCLVFRSIKVQGSIYQILYKDGSCYKGQMLNNMRHGLGVHYLDGIQYEGMWHFDKAQGKGKLKSKHFEAEGHFQGNHIIKGRMKVFRGKQTELYQGEFEDFKYHGKGILTILGQSRYQGQFKHHKKQGKGKMVYENGSSYQGQFKNGLICGHGTYKSMQFQYCGDFIDNKISGKGSCKALNDPIVNHTRSETEKALELSVQTTKPRTATEMHSFTFSKPKLRA